MWSTIICWSDQKLCIRFGDIEILENPPTRAQAKIRTRTHTHTCTHATLALKKVFSAMQQYRIAHDYIY